MIDKFVDRFGAGAQSPVDLLAVKMPKSEVGVLLVAIEETEDLDLPSIISELLSVASDHLPVSQLGGVEKNAYFPGILPIDTFRFARSPLVFFLQEVIVKAQSNIFDQSHRNGIGDRKSSSSF